MYRNDVDKNAFKATRIITQSRADQVILTHIAFMFMGCNYDVWYLHTSVRDIGCTFYVLTCNDHCILIYSDSMLLLYIFFFFVRIVWMSFESNRFSRLVNRQQFIHTVTNEVVSSKPASLPHFRVISLKKISLATLIPSIEPYATMI